MVMPPLLRATIEDTSSNQPELEYRRDGCLCITRMPGLARSRASWFASCYLLTVMPSNIIKPICNWLTETARTRLLSIG